MPFGDSASNRFGVSDYGVISYCLSAHFVYDYGHWPGWVCVPAGAIISVDGRLLMMSGLRRNCICTGLLALAMTLGLSLGAWGQATTSVRGAVTDPSGAAIPGAAVTITNVATNTVRRSATDQDGRYTFAAVLPGTYTLQVRA
ncbi:MAG: carboxypeptidase-like regulatory domain-containing protein, partial [Terriglobales bacterium]